MIGFSGAAPSQLFNNETFDRTVCKDMHSCRDSLLIESPFIRLNNVIFMQAA